MARPKRYNPEDRAKKAPRSPTGRDDSIRKDRVAWVRAHWLDVGQSRELPEDEEDGDGVDHVLHLYTSKGRGGITINLSRFTVLELEAIKEVIDRAFGEAHDECRRRDAAAQEAYENGDDSFARLYRQVPRVFYRKGEKPPHGSRLRSGPTGIVEGHIPTDQKPEDV